MDLAIKAKLVCMDKVAMENPAVQEYLAQCAKVIEAELHKKGLTYISVQAGDPNA